MSISARHAYRFGFLKSEWWKTVRSQALLLADGKCVVCSKEDAGNDAHHIKYAKKWKETKATDLVILCRIHHRWAHFLKRVWPRSRAMEIIRMMVREQVDWRKVLNNISKTGDWARCERLERKAEFFTVIKHLNKKLLTVSTSKE